MTGVQTCALPIYAAEAEGMGLLSGALAGEPVPEQAVPVRWRGPFRLFGREERRCGEACGMSFRSGCRTKDASDVSFLRRRAGLRFVSLSWKTGEERTCRNSS